MKPDPQWWWLALVAALLLATAGPAAAMRCEGRVVGSGDRDFQVLQRCGEPDWIDRSSRFETVGAGGPLERRREIVVETWYYDAGPNRLVRRLEFVDGRLQRSGTAGHGQRGGGRTACRDADFTRGASPGQIALRCGEPDSRSSRYRDEIVRDGTGREVLRPRQYEEWVYAGRAGELSRLLVFEDQRLASVRTLRR